MTEELGVIGCSLPVVGYVGERCSGHQICEFPVAELRATQPCPDFVPSYLAARYQCVLGKLLAPFVHSFILVFIVVVLLSQVFISFFLRICTVLFYFSVSCFVTVMAVLVTTLVLQLLLNLDFDLDLVHKKYYRM